ncbi:MAG: hypothetical protein Q9216_003166 [Gyalolechia sp. 2 TL-2023]
MTQTISSNSNEEKTVEKQETTNERSLVERDFLTVPNSFSTQTKSQPSVPRHDTYAFKAPAQVAASSTTLSESRVRYTLLIARINASPPSIVYLYYAFAWGYQELKDTILDKLREDSRRGYYEIPPGLKTKDITVQSPVALGTSPLTEENYAVWAMWYYEQIGEGQTGESREGMLEVDLRHTRLKRNTEVYLKVNPLVSNQKRRIGLGWIGALAMSGRVFLIALPEWREDKEEYLQPEGPANPDTKPRKWDIKRLFRKRKGDKEENKARGEALVTEPRIEGQIRLVVKAKILQDPWRYAWAGINIPPTATYREFAGYALKELRRQNLHPSRIPRWILVRGLVVEWGTKDSRGRSLPRILDEDNFQGSLLLYDGGEKDMERPPEVEIMVHITCKPTPEIPNPPPDPT